MEDPALVTLTGLGVARLGLATTRLGLTLTLLEDCRECRGSGEVGVVITQNLVKRLQPRVMVVQDANGNPLLPHKILDLVKEPMATADEPYRIRRTLDQATVQIDARELFL